MDEEQNKYNHEAVEPGELSEVDMGRCVSIVVAGGAVNADSATRGLAHASKLLVVRTSGKIVAVGAIKRALPSYVAGVARKAAHDLPDDAQELGYVAIRCIAGSTYRRESCDACGKSTTAGCSPLRMTRR